MKDYVTKKIGKWDVICTEKNYEQFKKKLENLEISEKQFSDFLKRQKLEIVRLERHGYTLILKIKGENELLMGIRHDDKCILIKGKNIFLRYEISKGGEKIVEISYSKESTIIKFEGGMFCLVFEERKIFTVSSAGDLTNNEIKIIFKSLLKPELQQNRIPKCEFEKLKGEIKSAVSNKALKITSDYIV